jgi:hypothetical protein
MDISISSTGKPLACNARGSGIKSRRDVLLFYVQVSRCRNVRYSRACAQWNYFSGQSSDANVTQTRLVAPRVKSSLYKLYGRHHNLIDRYEMVIFLIARDLFLFTFK